MIVVQQGLEELHLKVNSKSISPLLRAVVHMMHSLAKLTHHHAAHVLPSYLSKHLI